MTDLGLMPTYKTDDMAAYKHAWQEIQSDKFDTMYF